MKKLIYNQEVLNKLWDSFSYKPNTGKVYLNESYFSHVTSSSSKVGSQVPVTYLGNYPIVNFLGYRIGLHNLCWFLKTGMYPVVPIDHIDHDTSNTKWSNLRKVTTADNNRNTSLRKDSATGVQGVYWNSSKKVYIAHIRTTQTVFKEGKATKITVRWEESFKSLISAKIARERKLKELGFHENHGKS